MKVIDNFLKPADFDRIQEYFFGALVPWKYNPFKVRKDENTESMQFTHVVYQAARFPVFQEMSMQVLDPLWMKLDIDVLIRAKANLTPKTVEPDYSLYHVDTAQNNTTAIFYLNTNNGFTRFKDGTKVNSIANRIVIFDAQTEHSGVTCTDEKVRGVLNVNYLSKILT